ncbi:MAG: SDR family oxidoreductase [bacterium]|jgi:NADP-dependent 3-hydroxy acid dehydrogenase YdfG|nr:SDR family NAD(P)-dependent oxidoreductase [Burkholderiales bacterium]
MTQRRLVVTGASQGIGAALVEQARAAGHQVTFTGRDRARVEALAAKTGAHGLVADVTIGDDNQRTVDTAVSRMGGVDVLVNNAGYAYRAEIGAPRTACGSAVPRRRAASFR